MTIIMGQDSTPEVTPIVNATAIQDYGGTEALVVQSGNTDGEGEIIPLVDVFVDDPNNPDSAATSTPKWRDLPFAILFWVHLAVMIWLGVTVAPKGYELFDVNVFGEIEKAMQKSDDVTEEDIQHFKGFVDQAAAYLQVYPTRIGLYCALPLCFLAFVFGLVGTSAVLKPCPRTMVYSCLVSTIAWTCIVLLGSAISTGSIGLYFMTGISLVAVGYYVRLAWKMVPFAAVNLKLALEGIGRNCGIFIVAFFFAEIGFLWVVYWFYVMIGTSSYENNKCQAEHPDQNFDMDSDDYSDVCDPPLAVVIFFLLSLYWTGAIFMNTMQVSVAGVMATWCFDKSDADNCCSPAIGGSLFRSLTYSFGSICLGSLFEAIVAVLRYLIDSARAQREQDSDRGACGTILLCIVDCLAELLEELLKSFNRWAYVYVGLYGTSYIDSGKRVIELFTSRGFTAIITDNLVGYVLGFASFAIGMVTAFAGWLIQHWAGSDDGSDETGHSYIFGPLPVPGVWASLIGFLVGLWVSSVMMNVLKGAVNTLIVCWADSPAAMQAQHPKLTAELSETYQDVFDMLGVPTAAFGEPMSPAVPV